MNLVENMKKRVYRRGIPLIEGEDGLLFTEF